ncbi:MAG: N-acetylneuraminate synthase family protein [Selenomonadaceae bacterium]|nr:N-acetylneuraminate synthase family protein [Selenomonadaceae bacterium]
MAKKEIKLGDVVVNGSSKPYLIAEIGINHNGDMQIAKRLIDAAFACGWDSVKFQKREPDIAVPEAQKNVPRETPWGTMTYLEYKKRIEFGKEEYDDIDKYCRIKPIAWTASPWDIPSLRFLLQYDLPFIKMPSAMLTNDELLKEAAASCKPLIVSTGMSTIEEIDHAVELLEKAGGNFILMHTNSSYPTQNDELNINLIHTLMERYDCLVGYSGHEMDLMPSVVAVAMGACVIERHVTLDHNMWGTDQKASVSISGMVALRGRIDKVTDIMGSGKKVLTESELIVRKKLRG